jgi:hypothetical protein
MENAMSSPGFLRASARRSLLALLVAGGVMTVTPVRAAPFTSGVDGSFEQEVEVGLEAGATIGGTLDGPASDEGDALGAAADGAADVAAVVEGTADGAGADGVAEVEAVAVGDPVQGGPQDPGPGPLGNLGDLAGSLLGDDGTNEDPGTDLPGTPDGLSIGGVPIELTDKPLNRLPHLVPHPPGDGPDDASPGTKPATRPSVLPAGLSQPATGRIAVSPLLLTAPAPVASPQTVDPPSVAPISRSPLPRTGPGTLFQGPFALTLLSASVAVRAAVRRRPRLG